MRIAQFSDSFLPIVDGVGRVVLSYANNLADKGNECYVIAPMTNTGYRGGYKFEMVDYKAVKLTGRQYKVGVPIMTDFGAEKIKVIKEVRAITSLGLAEAKALVEGVPAKIKEGVNKEEAATLKAQLEGVGAKVELK